MYPSIFCRTVLRLVLRLVLTVAIVTVSVKAQQATSAINQSGFVQIGGISQWIGVNGEDRNNSIILVVHGGPGEAQWPQAARYKPWEKEFTVVQWDQRGTGRTYSHNKEQTSNVNLKQIVSDGIEVAEYLCHNYGKKKIIVLGHSWGSIVAVNMAKRRPDLFAAYVGTGQVASWAASVQSQFNLLIAKARADGDTESLKMLEAIGKPDPENTQQYFNFSKNLFAAMAPSDQTWLTGLRKATPTSIGISQKDYENLIDGMTFSSRHLLPDQVATDLTKTAAEIRTAFFVIQGHNDVITPTSVAIDYFKQVKTPIKELILIDGGHFAFMTHGKQFLDALVKIVRPVAVSRGA